MSILIKGMAMPTSCVDCPMMQDENGYCKLRKEYVYGDIPRSCPLVPVPPHGRLIDGDALYNESRERCLWWAEDYELGDMLDDIKNAPTIIESEE